MLGVSIEKQRITDAISAIDREMARRVSPEKKAKLRAERENLIGQLNRMKVEYVGLDIYVEPDARAIKLCLWERATDFAGAALLAAQLSARSPVR